jgi:restriction endonuclease
MPRQGRALEQLVAELERVLGPTDVVIQSPEYIVGRNTGQRREVDVSLRTKIGSSDLFVMIECRDRGGKQSATWIEQIVSKQEDVGANKAVAVCPAGFTRGARQLAEAKGIDLRTIASVTDAEVFAWLLLETVRYRDWNMEYRTIKFGVDGDWEFEPGVAESLNASNAGLVPVLVRRSDGNAVSVHDVFNTVSMDELLAELEPDKHHAVTVAIDVQGDPPPYQIRTDDGLVDLEGLAVGGFLSYTQGQLPISRRYEYVDESGSLVQTAEVEVAYKGARVVFGLNATPDKKRHSVTVMRGPDSGPDVIHIQTSGLYQGVIGEDVSARGRLTI